MNVIARFILLLGTLATCACTAAGLHSFAVVCVNLSNEPVSEVRIIDSSDEYNYGCGYLGVRGYKANAGPMETSPSDVFTVTWLDHAGQKRSKKIDTRSFVSTGFRGELVFIYGPSGDFTIEAHPQHGYPIPKQAPNQVPEPTSGLAPGRGSS